MMSAPAVAVQQIVPCEALEVLAAHKAIQPVVEAVAVAVETAADEPQLFHVVRQRIADG